MSAAARSVAIIRARLRERLAEPVAEIEGTIAAPLDELVGSTWGTEAAEEARVLRERQRPIGRPRKVVERAAAAPPRTPRTPKAPRPTIAPVVHLPVVTAPAFVAGPGARRETCRGYEACLSNHTRGPLRSAHGHCPDGCSGFAAIGRSDRVAGINARAQGNFE